MSGAAAISIFILLLFFKLKKEDRQTVGLQPLSRNGYQSQHHIIQSISLIEHADSPQWLSAFLLSAQENTDVPPTADSGDARC